MLRTNYSSNLSDEQWQLIRRFLPKPSRRGRPRIDRRWILDAILYVVRTGCQKEETTQRRHSRQPVGADSRGWSRAWIRWCQANHWSQAAHCRGYAGADRVDCRARSLLAGSRWSLLSADETSASLPPPQGLVRRFSIWPKGTAGVGLADVRLGVARRAAASRDQKVCRLAQTLDRGADLRLAGPVSPTCERLRANTRVQRSGHLHRHDQSHEQATRKDEILIFKHVLRLCKVYRILTK